MGLHGEANLTEYRLVANSSRYHTSSVREGYTFRAAATNQIAEDFISNDIVGQLPQIGDRDQLRALPVRTWIRGTWGTTGAAESVLHKKGVSSTCYSARFSPRVTG